MKKIYWLYLLKSHFVNESQLYKIESLHAGLFELMSMPLFSTSFLQTPYPYWQIDRSLFHAYMNFV